MELQQMNSANKISDLCHFNSRLVALYLRAAYNLCSSIEFSLRVYGGRGQFKIRVHPPGLGRRQVASLFWKIEQRSGSVMTTLLA